jgi:hypothetical protein
MSATSAVVACVRRADEFGDGVHPTPNVTIGGARRALPANRRLGHARFLAALMGSTGSGA